MDPLEIPDTIDEATDLEGLASKVTDRVAELRALPADEVTDEVTDELERLADLNDKILAEQSARADAAAERQARYDAAAARFDPPAETETAEVVEAETTEVEPAPAPEPVAETQAVEPAPVPAAASTGGGSVAGLASRAPAAVAPSKRSEHSGVTLRTTEFAAKTKAGTEVTDLLQVGEILAATNKAFAGRGNTGPRSFVSVVTGEKAMGDRPELGGDEMRNFSILEKLRQGATDYEALVASGPFCTPQTPLYDFFRLSVAQTPVEQDLVTVQAPRGGIRYIVPPDTTSAVNAGIGFVDEADIDPDDEDTWKPCTRVVCPTLADEFVTGVSQCVTFGNLAYKTFAEQTAAFLEDLAVAFASRKETYYLDYIDGKSTAVTGRATGFGALRQHFYNLTQAAAQYRKRRGMVRGATLKVYEPDWLLDLLKLDMLMDADQGVDNLVVADAIINAAYSARGLDVVWYNDSATGRNQKWAQAQAQGDINLFPTTVQSYLFAPGTFVRLDAGSFDAGLTRDSKLNRTNDVQLFMEEWIGMAMLGLESVRLIDRVCPNGLATPRASSALACA